ncbi:MAG: inorganic pyrophosphatase [Bradymonadia bacterium]|jgi:inorganic pyrophosphatase
MTIVMARDLGVKRMCDDKGLDDKIIAVCIDAPALNHLQDLNELPPYLLLEIRRFFEDYKALENEEVVVDHPLPRADALTTLVEALEMYKSWRRGGDS